MPKKMVKKYDILSPKGTAITVQKTKRGDKATKKRNDPKTYKTHLKSDR